MALIKCKDCGADMSDQAPMCPKCGYSLHVAGFRTHVTSFGGWLKKEVREKLTYAVIAFLATHGIFFGLKLNYTAKQREQVLNLYNVWRTVLDQGDTRRHFEWFKRQNLTEQQMEALLQSKVVRNEPVGNNEPLNSRKYGKNSEQPAKLLLTAKESAAVHRDLVAILNLLEQVAVAYRDDLAEDKMIETYFKPAVTSYRFALNSYCSQWARVNNQDGWPDLDEVIKQDWKGPYKRSKLYDETSFWHAISELPWRYFMNSPVKTH